MSIPERHVLWLGGGVREIDTTSSVRPWSDSANLQSHCMRGAVSAWEEAAAAAILITYGVRELSILPGSNPESIDERVGGGGGQCEDLEMLRGWGVVHASGQTER